jgi:hypothetical protein
VASESATSTAVSLPLAIRYPTVSRDASSRGKSPTRRPRNSTPMRSDRLKISSSSADTSSTAAPASRISMIRLWMNSIDPTSRPRVGWATISSLGSPDSSRAMITFCWLPPDSVATGAWMPEARMS